MSGEERTAVGAVVGHFKVPEQTVGHREVLDVVMAKGHDRNGPVPGVPPSDNSPLDFVAGAETNGAVLATQRQYPRVYQTVDVALTDRFDHLYLCRKHTDPQYTWRFVGGFVDPADTSLEWAAMRELREETGIDVGASRDDAGDYAAGASLAYVCSARLDDRRCRGERDGIVTALFAVHVDADMRAPRPADDICDVARFDDWWLKPPRVVTEHQPLMDALVRWFTEN